MHMSPLAVRAARCCSQPQLRQLPLPFLSSINQFIAGSRQLLHSTCSSGVLGLWDGHSDELRRYHGAQRVYPTKDRREMTCLDVTTRTSSSTYRPGISYILGFRPSVVRQAAVINDDQHTFDLSSIRKNNEESIASKTRTERTEDDTTEQEVGGENNKLGGVVLDDIVLKRLSRKVKFHFRRAHALKRAIHRLEKMQSAAEAASQKEQTKDYNQTQSGWAEGIMELVLFLSFGIIGLALWFYLAKIGFALWRYYGTLEKEQDRKSNETKNGDNATKQTIKNIIALFLAVVLLPWYLPILMLMLLTQKPPDPPLVRAVETIPFKHTTENKCNPPTSWFRLWADGVHEETEEDPLGKGTSRTWTI